MVPQATNNHYSGTLGIVTAGYACPKENEHGEESQHIYGKAFDFDAGVDDTTNFRKNWEGRNGLKSRENSTARNLIFPSFSIYAVISG